MQKKKKKQTWVFLLWICFFAVIGIVSYLSFQNGESAKALGKQFIQYTAEKTYGGESVSDEEMLGLTYLIRQFGRVAAFFTVGFLGTAAVHVSFKKWNFMVKTIISLLIIVPFAYLTEKLKVFIPSRHYSYEEMMYSLIAVIAGFLVVSVFTFLFCMFKRLFRLEASTMH
ncbi:MAG: VanZ family protein [Suilimivivens sp.]